MCDFETDADVARLKWASRGQNNLERSSAFASRGEASLKFTSPTWKQGMTEWPAFEFQPGEHDWSSYDRLVVDITNPTAEAHHFALSISDSKMPVRQGLSYTFKLPELGYQRFLIPLSAFPAEVNRADIALLHFLTERPRTGLALHLDHIRLLKSGESLPEPGTKFVRQLIPLKIDHLAMAEQTLGRYRAASAGSGVDAQFAASEQHLKTIRCELASPDITLAALQSWTEELSVLPQTVERLAAITRFHKACVAQGQPGSNMLVGWATSMEKILPRAVLVDLQPAREIDLSLARNEKESFQLLVLPAATNLKQVAVTVSDLKSASATLLPESGASRRKICRKWPKSGVLPESFCSSRSFSMSAASGVERQKL